MVLVRPLPWSGLDVGAIAPGLGFDPLPWPRRRPSRAMGSSTAQLLRTASRVAVLRWPSTTWTEGSQIARHYSNLRRAEASLRPGLDLNGVFARSNDDASSRAGSDFDVFAVGCVAGGTVWRREKGLAVHVARERALMMVVERGSWLECGSSGSSCRRRLWQRVVPPQGRPAPLRSAGLPALRWRGRRSASPPGA